MLEINDHVIVIIPIILTIASGYCVHSNREKLFTLNQIIGFPTIIDKDEGLHKPEVKMVPSKLDSSVFLTLHVLSSRLHAHSHTSGWTSGQQFLYNNRDAVIRPGIM